MATIASLLVNLGMNTAAFEAGTNRARRSMNTMSRDIQASAARMKSLATAAAGIFVGVRMLGYVKSQMQAIDTTAKLSNSLGVATEQLMGFQRAAEIGGASTEMMNKSLEYLAKNLGMAITTGGAAALTVQRLGLNAQQLAAGNMGESFLKVAQAISELPTPAERATAAMELFGRGGIELLPILSQGRAGIEQITAAMIKSGEAFSNLDASQVEAANDAITNMAGALKGLLNQVLIQLSPTFVEVANAIVSAARAIDWFARATLGSIGNVIHFVGNAWAFVKILGVVNRAIVWLIAAYRSMAIAQGIVNALMSASATGVAAFAVSAVLATAAVVAINAQFDGLDTQARKAASGLNSVAAATDNIEKAEVRLRRTQRGLKDVLGVNANEFDDLIARQWELERRLEGWSDTRIRMTALMRNATHEERALAVARTENLQQSIAGYERIIERQELERDILRQIRQEQELFGKGPYAEELLRLERAGTSYERLESIRREVDAWEKQKAAINAVAESQRRLTEIGKHWFDATRTPAEKFAAAIREINDAFIAGKMSFDTWLRAADQISRQHAGESPSRGEFRQIESARIDVRGLAADTKHRDLQVQEKQLGALLMIENDINEIVREGGGLRA